jgi:hypothetical protein
MKYILCRGFELLTELPQFLDLADNSTEYLLESPESFVLKSMSLWKINQDKTRVVKKEGQELIDAQEALLKERRPKLIERYAGKSLNPVTLGNLEGATDILVFFMNKIINEESFLPEEKSIWDSFYSKVSPHFKVSLTDIPNEEDGLAAAKAQARQAEINMKNDPDWNLPE